MNEIQHVILNIYKEVSKLCFTYNIEHFAIGGTCIGAIRHSGFIPWDDDLDIAVPIEQWDKFINIMKSYLPAHLKLFTSSDSIHNNMFFAKIYDCNTTFIDKNIYMNKYYDAFTGIYIDIMPICGLPDKNSTTFFKRLLWLSSLNDVRRFRLNKQLSIKRKLMRAISYPTNLIIPFWFYSELFMRELKRYPLYTSKRTSYVWSRNAQHLIFDSAWFKTSILVSFEDTEIPCPIGYNSYLEMQFGEYMQLPPINERVSHHHGLVNTAKPFQEYII